MGECHSIPDNDAVSRRRPRKEGEGAQAPSPRLPRTVDSIGWATRRWAEGKASLAPPGFVVSRSREFRLHSRARTKKRISPLSSHGRIRHESGLELRGVFRGVLDPVDQSTLSFPSRGSRVRVPFPAPEHIYTKGRLGISPSLFRLKAATICFLGRGFALLCVSCGGQESHPYLISCDVLAILLPWRQRVGAGHACSLQKGRLEMLEAGGGEG